MIHRILRRAALLGLLALVPLGAFSAFAAANDVPETGADTHTEGISANDLKPGACSGITLDNVVSGSGVITDGAANSLITGSDQSDTINGGGGDDCIVAGDGIDTLVGGTGTDVCIGGGGLDIIDPTCETQIQ